MALTLEDVILRRTGLGSAGYPGDEAVMKVEALDARTRWAGRPRARRTRVQLLKEFYLPLTA